MRKKQKTRLRIREYANNGKASFSSIEKKKRELNDHVQSLAKKRSKLTEDLRKISIDSSGLGQISQAGMLAHYAAIAVILGSIVKASGKKYYEKELQKLGAHDMDYETKLANLGAFEKVVLSAEKGYKVYNNCTEEEKQERYKEWKAMCDQRDYIARELGLDSNEFTALSDVFKSNEANITKLPSMLEVLLETDDGTPSKEQVKESLEGVCEQIKEIKAKYGDSSLEGDDVVKLAELEDKRDELFWQLKSDPDVEPEELEEAVEMIRGSAETQTSSLMDLKI